MPAAAVVAGCHQATLLQSDSGYLPSVPRVRQCLSETLPRAGSLNGAWKANSHS